MATSRTLLRLLLDNKALISNLRTSHRNLSRRLFEAWAAVWDHAANKNTAIFNLAKRTVGLYRHLVMVKNNQLDEARMVTKYLEEMLGEKDVIVIRTRAELVAVRIMQRRLHWEGSIRNLGQNAADFHLIDQWILNTAGVQNLNDE
ncbi:hypothetical protein V6N13_021462 [Hibiscus sabdariffa]|uniref:Uncharacterized protein n=2 Tax=Hibiscus sabdariffa TaxID=183260 RepID=A0ABR2NPJ2_9ROSI